MTNSKEKSYFLTVRHLQDRNALKSCGHNGPLEKGQEVLISSILEKISESLKISGKKKIKILYTFKTRRIKETANLIIRNFQQKGIEVTSQHDYRLEVMDQGTLILPTDYKDGDWFDPLDFAWDVICDEAYVNKNIFYRFGDSLDGKYPVLKESFSVLGESLAWSLINKYSLINDLINSKFTNKDELLIIVSQSDLPLVLMELQALCNFKGVNCKNLPYKCWEIYKSGLQQSMHDYSAKGLGNFDIPMGYVGKFDLSNFLENKFNKIIIEAGKYLIKIKNKKNEKK